MFHDDGRNGVPRMIKRTRLRMRPSSYCIVIGREYRSTPGEQSACSVTSCIKKIVCFFLPWRCCCHKSGTGAGTAAGTGTAAIGGSAETTASFIGIPGICKEYVHIFAIYL